MARKTPGAKEMPRKIEAHNLASRKGELKLLGGSQSDDWNNALANQAVQTLWVKNSKPEDLDRQLNAVVAALIGIAPQDELEAMLAAQLIGAHNAAMECYRRAMIAEQTFEGRRESLSQANKLSRTYAALIEALNRHRGKGQQKVTVEHVHVHAGGQAVVGMVASSALAGGGEGKKSEELPHAKQMGAGSANHAGEPAMPCAHARARALPGAGDGERALPHARGNSARRAKGQ